MKGLMTQGRKQDSDGLSDSRLDVLLCQEGRGCRGRSHREAVFLGVCGRLRAAKKSAREPAQGAAATDAATEQLVALPL